MSRYIDADAFDDTVQKLNEQGWHITRIDYKRMDRILFEMPTVDIPQWIPCSERLPYSQEDVLCDDDGRVTIGYYTDEEVGWHDTHSYRIYPTAWMPLPEPWKGGRG